jgi:hypothetical protein
MSRGRIMVAGALVLALAGCGDDELPTAANGRDLAACADGSCEVLVRDGDVVEVDGLGRVEVGIEDDMLEVAVSNRDEQGNGSDMSASGAADRTLVMNGQEFRVVAVLGDQGVLRVGG